MLKLKAHIVSRGSANGEALVTSQPISFLGSVDPMTGIVVEKGHELSGKSIKGKVLVFPSGKGSTVGSYVIYQLKKNGVAPSAMINIKTELSSIGRKCKTFSKNVSKGSTINFLKNSLILDHLSLIPIIN